MPIRSILLRVLFWSLALAAIFGALGILFASHDTIWRTAGTSITTAGAALLLLAASALMDKPGYRPASLLAITLIVIEYLLTLGAIWDLGPSGYRYIDPLTLTVLFVALVGVPAIVLMRLAAIKLTALAGCVGLVLAAVELAILLLLAWGRSSWTSSWALGDLAGLLPLFGLLALICLIGQGQSPRRLWRWIGVTTATAAFCITAYGSIKQLHQGGEIVVYITCVAAAVAHANIVLLFTLRPTQLWLRWLTIAAGIATASFIALTTYMGQNGDGMLPRVAGACGIIAGCGTLALAVLARLNRRFVATPGTIAGLSEITLICPLCHKRQTLALGGAQCAECHAVIHVRVEEPRCATCGYSLLMLQSGVCPECGTRVPAVGVVAPESPKASPAIP